MLQLGYIEIDYVNAGILKVTPLGRKILFGEQKAMMSIYKEPEEKTYFRRKDSKFKYRPIKPLKSASQTDRRERTDTGLYHLFR